MEWSEENHDLSRGGFQNRDIGKSNFRKDFGNDYGVDFARFAEAPDVTRDQMLEVLIKAHLKKLQVSCDDIKIRNGFVFIALSNESATVRHELNAEISNIPGVRHVHLSRTK